MSAPAPHNGSLEAASGLGETLGHSLIERIGNTPLLRLDALTADLPGVALLGKAEWYNPGGSVKDRAAANIVCGSPPPRPTPPRPDSARLPPAATPALLMPCWAPPKDSPSRSACPQNVSRERKQILQGYGANILYTDPADGSDGAIRMARELAAKHPDQYFYADQYSNEANWKAHYHGTANEIWQQTQGTRHALRLHARHQRNLRRNHAPPEGTEPCGAVHLAAARLVVSRNRRRQAHGQRDRAENLRSAARRSESRNLDRRRLRHGSESLAQRRIAGRHFRRRRRRGMLARSPAICSRKRKARRPSS